MKAYTENIVLINTILFVLSKENTATAYFKKVENLKSQGLSDLEIQLIMAAPIEMEVYYDSDADSIFMVEALAVDNITIRNPYNIGDLEDAYDNNKLDKDVMIEEIQSIVNSFGSFQFGELDVESYITPIESEEKISTAVGIDENGLIMATHLKATDEEVSSFSQPLINIPYIDIENLYDIAHIYLAEKLEK